MIPAMTSPEIAFLAEHLLLTDHVFEWGSGGSTVWLAHRVKRVTSVEHNPLWAAKTSLDLWGAGCRNASVLYVPPDRPYAEGSEDDGDAETFSAYAASYLGADVVVIDGRARNACANVVAAFSGVSGEAPRLVFLHDCDRRQYAPIWDTYLRETGRVGQLMRLECR